MMLAGSRCGEHTRLTQRSALRLVPKSVDESDGRMTVAVSLGDPRSAEQER